MLLDTITIKLNSLTPPPSPPQGGDLENPCISIELFYVFYVKNGRESYFLGRSPKKGRGLIFSGDLKFSMFSMLKMGGGLIFWGGRPKRMGGGLIFSGDINKGGCLILGVGLIFLRIGPK